MKFAKSTPFYHALSTLALASPLLWATQVSASLEKPIDWSELSVLDLQKVLRSHYASPSNLYDPVVTPSAQYLAMTDADHRVSESFRIPAPMKDIVGFWLKIYTHYSTRHFVIYDRFHPEIIYQVMDFRELHSRAKSPVNYELNREAMIKRKFREVRGAFQAVARKSRQRNFKPEKLSSLERSIYDAVKKHPHRHSWAEWERNLRGQTGQRDNVMKGLLAAETFIPKMEEIFRQLDVPAELTRIPLVESSFNLSAHSKAGARGVWQFMERSGREYMIVNPQSGIDERISPLKSTVAAARLLKRNLISTGNWPLAITAYNHGFTGIRKLSASQRAQAIDGHLFQPCQKKRYLGYASSNYYAEFLALLHAEKYRDLFYGESPLPEAPKLTFHRLTKSESAIEFARRWKVSIHDLRLYNPDILNLNRKLPAGLFLATPSESPMAFDDLISSIRPRPMAKRR